MKIKIEPYNVMWPNIFKELKCQIRNKINEDDISIEHIGSTSVNNLSSKPIIDILIGVQSIKLDNYIMPIIDIGFTYVKEYEKETPNRRFFFLDHNFKRISHIHLVQINSMWYKRHIAFRDELRSNEFVKKEYENLKYNLAKEDWLNVDAYSNAKTKFIRSIEKRILYEN